MPNLDKNQIEALRQQKGKLLDFKTNNANLLDKVTLWTLEYAIQSLDKAITNLEEINL